MGIWRKYLIYNMIVDGMSIEFQPERITKNKQTNKTKTINHENEKSNPQKIW
jgi:hypothetical protein